MPKSNRICMSVAYHRYNQLLKLFLWTWTFTLPFVIVDEMGWWTPMVMAFVSASYFGLDQVKLADAPMQREIRTTRTPTPRRPPRRAHNKVTQIGPCGCGPPHSLLPNTYVHPHRT